MQDGVVDAQDALLAIDAAEKIYRIAKREAHKYSPQFRAVIGMGTLFYSRSFPYTIMFVRAFQVPASAAAHIMTRPSHLHICIDVCRQIVDVMLASADEVLQKSRHVHGLSLR